MGDNNPADLRLESHLFIVLADFGGQRKHVHYDHAAFQLDYLGANRPYVPFSIALQGGKMPIYEPGLASLVETNVREERLKVLYVDNEPRYEFRYLKNYLDREESIDLNVVLLSSDPAYSEQDRAALPTFPAFRRASARSGSWPRKPG